MVCISPADRLFGIYSISSSQFLYLCLNEEGGLEVIKVSLECIGKKKKNHNAWVQCSKIPSWAFRASLPCPGFQRWPCHSLFLAVNWGHISKTSLNMKNFFGGGSLFCHLSWKYALLTYFFFPSMLSLEKFLCLCILVGLLFRNTCLWSCNIYVSEYYLFSL